MAPRPQWKGHLKLSLVSCAVDLFAATASNARVRFNIINRKTGHRVHNELVDAETGERVAEPDRAKGYKLEGDRYLLLEDEDFERVALESTHTLDVEAFVPRGEVDEIYFDAPYFVVPSDPVGFEAFAVIREAMRKENLVGLARAVMGRRERMLMLEPRDKGLLAVSLRFHQEVRAEHAYLADLPETRVSPDMLDLAAHIMRGKLRRFDPATIEDRYEQALAALINAKRAGQEPEAPKPAEPGNVVNLMDALRRSLEETRAETSPRTGAEAAETPRSTARRPLPSRRRIRQAG